MKTILNDGVCRSCRPVVSNGIAEQLLACAGAPIPGRAFATLALCLLLLLCRPAHSADSTTTLFFSQSDLTTNFTNSYTFSLTAPSSVDYSASFSFDLCRNGCGSPSFSYGIYDANGGGLIGSAGPGTVMLSAGEYAFQVTGTGMGSGNNLTYTALVTYMTGSSEFVSPAPEPATNLLILIGGGLVAWAIRGQASRRLFGMSTPSRFEAAMLTPHIIRLGEATP